MLISSTNYNFTGASYIWRGESRGTGFKGPVNHQICLSRSRRFYNSGRLCKKTMFLSFQSSEIYYALFKS